MGVNESGESLLSETLTRNETSNENHCDQHALIGELGLFVQALLAFIAFSALISKLFVNSLKSL